MASITIMATLVFNGSLRIGYRVKNSSNPFTYIPAYPTANELPYIITGLSSSTYELELTQICPNCSGGVYADPIILDALPQ